MRITMVIGTLRLGGAERMLAFMANYWAARGWQVTLITYLNGPEQCPLSPQVRRVSAAVSADGRNVFSRAGAAVYRIWKLRRVILESEPQVVLSFLNEPNIRVLAALLGTKVPVVVAERSDPRHYRLSRPWTILRRCLYPRAAGLAVQTAGVRSFFDGYMRGRGWVIPNPVMLSAVASVVSARPATPVPARVLAALGRLERVKGFDLLIEAFSQIAGRNPDWQLVIYGDGAERNALEHLIAQKGLARQIQLPGTIHDVAGTLRQADLFVFSSRYEGFPNALCEAMACGLPAVSFDCQSGPGEIIRNGIDGVLVPPGDVQALAGVLAELMNDEAKRRQLAARAPEVVERFHPDRIMKMWEDLFQRVAPGAGGQGDAARLAPGGREGVVRQGKD